MKIGQKIITRKEWQFSGQIDIVALYDCHFIDMYNDVYSSYRLIVF